MAADAIAARHWRETDGVRRAELAHARAPCPLTQNLSTIYIKMMSFQRERIKTL